MVGYNLNKWTTQQRARLCELADAYRTRGKPPKWHLIAEDVGHPSLSCQTVMSKIRSKRRNEQIKAEVALMIEFEDQKPQPEAEPAPKPPAARAPVDLTDTMRCTSTAQLMLHSETRDRAGNWFGDPEPGRSALDKMRAGLRP